MIQVYADKELVYDSRLVRYDLLGLTVTTGLNKGGSAEITMPAGHPAYSLFTGFRTIVTIYRDGLLRFRGRALYPSDDYDNQRAWICEGELCLFQDGISRPYLYQADPASIFTAVVQDYNSQVEEFKQFKVGKVTVTDANDYIRLESETAESCLATLNKLLERCGGSFVFTTDITGDRVINWLETVESNSNQEIEFGENLLDFSRTAATTSLATGIVPYGAKNEETGERVTIASVNNGLDYLIAEDARAVRGTIMATKTWDDVTEPANLLTKARQHLNANRYIITSLTLTAMDLSYMDKTLDSFKVGDTILVKSIPHAVNDTFQLTEMTEDLLDPTQSKITLGKTINSLTAATVAGEAAAAGALRLFKTSIKTDYNTDVTKAVSEVKTELSSEIEQTHKNIMLEVSQKYVANDDLGDVITNSETQYYLSTSATETTGGEWSKNAPAWADGMYMWTKTVTTYYSGRKSESAPVCISGAAGAAGADGAAGAAGVGVQAVAAEYYLSTSKTEQLDGEWSATAPAWEIGKYLWTRTAITYTDGTTTYTVPVCDSSWEAANEVKTELTEEIKSSIQVLADSISLEVSGGLGNTAAIRLNVNGDVYTESMDLSAVRKAFADDTSTVTIEAGAVIFNAGTFAVNSEHFQVDTTGKVTATAGTIGALNLSATGIYSCNADAYGSYAGWYRPEEITTDTICLFAGATSQTGESADFSVTYGGKLTATGAEINGTLTTESSVYKAQLHSGGLGLYYDGELCGTVNTKYWSGASVPGISLRIEEAGQYIMFSHPSDAGTGYDVDYYLNYGWSTNYDEKHIFQTSARFLEKVYFSGSGAYFRAAYLYDNSFIRSVSSDGTVGEEMLGFSSDRVTVGSVGCDTMLRGTTVYLKNTNTTVTSDRNAKHSIENMPEAYEAFLDALQPVRFKYKEGTSGRYHTGYIAQDVAEALEAAGLTPKDFAGYVCLQGDGTLGLQYGEFVALLHMKIKRLEQRLAALSTPKNRRRKT